MTILIKNSCLFELIKHEYFLPHIFKSFKDTFFRTKIKTYIQLIINSILQKSVLCGLFYFELCIAFKCYILIVVSLLEETKNSIKKVSFQFLNSVLILICSKENTSLFLRIIPFINFYTVTHEHSTSQFSCVKQHT